MRSTRRFIALAVLAALLSACGGDTTTPDETPGTTGTETTVPTTEPTTPPTSEPTTEPVDGLEQPAIWPAADVVFATPEEAAEDFVTTALGVPATLGEFQAGDARSGEIPVMSPGEGDAATPVQRGLLLLRQLGPDDGWFVTAAPSDVATVESPEHASTVAAGQLTVEGVARGFEAAVTITAFVAGDATTVLDSAQVMAGAMETPEPYSVELDLTGAASGSTVVILVRGGTGLETDPGDFGAIAVVIG